MNTLDYEAELAVILGKKGRCGPDDDPWSFVFGYTLVNDVTSRGLQKHHSQWLLGKGIDGFCPMGPVLVTVDEIPDVNRLEIRCDVNGEERQRALLADLIFDIPTLIRTIGKSISFVPGDIIATGTPVGVGLGFDPPSICARAMSSAFPSRRLASCASRSSDRQNVLTVSPYVGF